MRCAFRTCSAGKFRLEVKLIKDSSLFVCVSINCGEKIFKAWNWIKKWGDLFRCCIIILQLKFGTQKKVNCVLLIQILQFQGCSCSIYRSWPKNKAILQRKIMNNIHWICWLTFVLYTEVLWQNSGKLLSFDRAIADQFFG